MEMDLTFLAHAPLPNEIWDQNFTSSIYLINKLSAYALPKFIPPSFSLHNKLDTWIHVPKGVWMCLLSSHETL